MSTFGEGKEGRGCSAVVGGKVAGRLACGGTVERAWSMIKHAVTIKWLVRCQTKCRQQSKHMAAVARRSAAALT